jgi:hypothetical protein
VSAGRRARGAARPTFHVQGCVIRGAKLAGLLYTLSTGMLSGSEVSGAEYSVAMNVGASPTIGEGNALSGTTQDKPTWVILVPCPAPPPTLPFAVTEQ